jgi:hypothetical protein
MTCQNLDKRRLIFLSRSQLTLVFAVLQFFLAGSGYAGIFGYAHQEECLQEEPKKLMRRWISPLPPKQAREVAREYCMQFPREIETFSDRQLEELLADCEPREQRNRRNFRDAALRAVTGMCGSGLRPVKPLREMSDRELRKVWSCCARSESPVGCGAPPPPRPMELDLFPGGEPEPRFPSGSAIGGFGTNICHEYRYELRRRETRGQNQ